MCDPFDRIAIQVLVLMISYHVISLFGETLIIPGSTLIQDFEKKLDLTLRISLKELVKIVIDVYAGFHYNIVDMYILHLVRLSIIFVLFWLKFT